MKTALIVDDSSFVRRFHTNLIKAGGYMADSASDGVEALEKALQNRYDVILSDINMPNMDGIEFVRRLREEVEEVPVIMISTQAEAHQMEDAFEAGANLYLIKPVKPAELLLNMQMVGGH